MPFLTHDPFPQCLQQSPLTPLLLARGHQRGSRRYLSDVKCLAVGLLATGGEAADPGAVQPGAGRGLGGAVPGAARTAMLVARSERHSLALIATLRRHL